MREATARRLVINRPASLTGTEAASPDAIRAGFASEVAWLSDQYESGVDEVAVQGQISSMKTWLLTCTAEEFLDNARRVVTLAPQRVNRRSIVTRLDDFGVPYIELPSRRDLCAWDAWLETVGRVDERTCSTNGCLMYPGDRDMEQLAADAVAKHRLEAGMDVRIDEQEAKRLAETFDPPVCPHYLLDAIEDYLPEKQAMRVATHAKALAGSGRDAPSADVVLVDESHTVGAATGLSRSRVNVAALVDTLRAACARFDGSATERARQAARDLEPLERALADWEKASHRRAVTPGELFDDLPLTLADSFDAVRAMSGVLMNEIQRAARTATISKKSESVRLYYGLKDVTSFLSELVAHREGHADFVHTRYETEGVARNDVTFRSVDDREAGVTPADVYAAWREHGTHPAIEARWGNLLDHHLEAIWKGRHLVPGGNRDTPGTIATPLETLRDLAGAETLIGYSATHNELSDRARSPADHRGTAHDLVTAPLYLRARGDTACQFHGRRTVTPHTPWFRDLVAEAKGATDARLAAVPINGAAAAKWDAMPVETLTLPDGSGGTTDRNGLVPNSQAAIGEKSLEALAIDAVLCGVQVQSPADTARRLIAYWELLAPGAADATGALEQSWRLLAQHALAGTIQAAGRFRTSATNIVLERPGIVELAGYESDPLASTMEGFPGAFARGFEALSDGFQRNRAVVRAKRIVRYLDEHDSKQPTRAQFLSKFTEVYDATKAQATEAFVAANEEGAVEYVAGRLRVIRSDEAGAR